MKPKKNIEINKFSTPLNLYIPIHLDIDFSILLAPEAEQTICAYKTTTISY